jgi:hypothetical protein
MGEEVDAGPRRLGPRGPLEVTDDWQPSSVGLVDGEAEQVGPDAGVELDEVDTGIRLGLTSSRSRCGERRGSEMIGPAVSMRGPRT